MTRFTLFYVTSALVVVHAASAQDWRKEMGAQRAGAIEAIVGLIAPGARIDWENEVSLTFAGGRRKALRLPGFLQLPMDGGELIVTGVEYPRDAQEGIKLLRAFAPVAPGWARTQIVLIRRSPNLAIRDSRVIVLHPESVATECRRIEVLDPPSADRWPRLTVTYRSWHSSDGAIGSVDWVSFVDPATGKATARTPNGFWRKAQNGTETEDLIQATPTAEGIRLTGVRSGSEWIVKCSLPCTVDAALFLALGS